MQKTLVFMTTAYALGLAAGLFTSDTIALTAAAAGLAAAASLFDGGKILLRLIFIGLAFAGGWGYSYLAESHNASSFPADAAGKQMTLSGVVASVPKIDGDMAMFKLRVQQKENVLVRITLQHQAEAELVSHWLPGDAAAIGGVLERPNEPGNYGDFDYRRYLHDRHIHWIMKVQGTDAIQIRKPQVWNRFLPLRWSEQWRKALSLDIARAFSEKHRALMNSLLLGLRDDFDPNMFDQFSRLGITHILAISGLHVAVVIGGLTVLLGKIGLPRERAITVAMCVIPLYVALTGASPSVNRAGLMAFLGLYALRRGMLKDALSLVCVTGAVLLTWNPYYLTDIGFQLSFLVTIGLIVGVPRVNELLPGKNLTVKNFFSVILTAQWASFPLTIHYFNGFSLLSPVANMFIVPLYSFVVLPLGYVAMIAAAIVRPLGELIAFPAELALEFSYRLVELLDRFHTLYLIWKTPSAWWIVAFYAISLVLLHRRISGRHPFGLSTGDTGKRTKAAVRYGLLLLMGLLLWSGYFPHVFAAKKAEVDFLDVGQGDSCLLRTAAGRYVLIDGGGTINFAKEEAWRERNDPFDIGADVLVPLLKRRGVHRLDALIVSHEDADHIGGLLAVLDRIPVKRLLFNGTLKKSPHAQALFAKALAKDVPLIVVTDNMRLRIDDKTEIAFLHPASFGSTGAGTGKAPDIALENNQNDASVVMLVRLSHASFLFTGDIGADVEQKIMLRHPQLQFAAPDVLKIAHHGSNKSSSGEWLDFWRPHIAVISVGAANVYGHPGQATLQRLSDRRVPAYRTDRNGEVQFHIHGASIKMRAKKNSKGSDSP